MPRRRGTPNRSTAHRSRVPRLLLALLVLLAACATGSGRSPEDEVVTVRVQAPVSTAVRRTLEAMRAQGYRVKETLTSGTEMETEPFEHGGGVEAVFRATITGSGSSSRVALTGTYHRKQFGGIVRGRDEPIVRSSEGVEGELWARLQNLGLAVRSAR
jgi:hypothetical protein